MVAYIVFTRERTRDQAELDTYSQEVSASLTGHAKQPAHTMAARKYSRARRSRAWSYWSFPLSRRPRPGMTAPPIARCGSTDTKAPTTAPSSSKASDAEEFYRRQRGRLIAELIEWD
jgi:hypothetical protein